jgi:DNA-binding LytR/AlgR family response regulator
MSASVSRSPLLLGLGAGEAKTSAIGWILFLGAAFAYCTLYEVAVLTTTPNYVGICLHILRDWGIWLLTTPLVFKALHQHGTAGRMHVGTRACVATVFLLASTAVPVTIDLWTQRLPLGASIAVHLPRYVAVLAVLYLIWRVHLHLRPDATPQTQPEPPKSYPQTLLVSRGADECLIAVERIESISAAGNYVEITAQGQRYLMRATMKQVEELLPPTDFIRIHRSHIVRREQIERIKREPSGHGTVHLRGGRALNMSKKYKSELQRFRPTLH